MPPGDRGNTNVAFSHNEMINIAMTANGITAYEFTHHSGDKGTIRCERDLPFRVIDAG